MQNRKTNAASIGAAIVAQVYEMIVFSMAAVATMALYSDHHPVNSADAAIHAARAKCGKGKVQIGQWYATIDGTSWTVWFGRNSKHPVCNDVGAVVAQDGSKTVCLVTVC
jgi:hypothetical protein